MKDLRLCPMNNLHLENYQNIGLRWYKSIKLQGSGVGIVLKSPSEDEIENHSICLNFSVSNNQAEYEAFIQGLIWAVDVRIKSLLVYSELHVVVRQLNEDYAVNSDNLKNYIEKVSQLKN